MSAPWLNPIEQRWRWLRQDVVHLHPWADDLPALWAAADACLARVHAAAAAGRDLLRYVGLELHDYFRNLHQPTDGDGGPRHRSISSTSINPRLNRRSPSGAENGGRRNREGLTGKTS